LEKPTPLCKVAAKRLRYASSQITLLLPAQMHLIDLFLNCSPPIAASLASKFRYPPERAELLRQVCSSQSQVAEINLIETTLVFPGFKGDQNDSSEMPPENFLFLRKKEKYL
jgi:hypothetical protein